ncbi:hypothetical protein OHO28_09210 [Streptomyces europaeiscabiei]|uniref:hypothetical protein n=1 Tax=Streptomyces europaeiscabiei TaxID=146819 RepID=UPI002E16F6F0
MVSGLGEIERRETASRVEIGELRAQLEELAERLPEQETVLSRREITRETMTEIPSGGEAVTEPESGPEDRLVLRSEQPGGSRPMQRSGGEPPRPTAEGRW